MSLTLLSSLRILLLILALFLLSVPNGWSLSLKEKWNDWTKKTTFNFTVVGKPVDPVDFDNDGIDEFISVEGSKGQKVMVVLEEDGKRAVKQFNDIDGLERFINAFDIYGDRRPEIFLEIITDGRLFIKAIRGEDFDKDTDYLTTVTEIEGFTEEGGHVRKAAGPDAVCDANGDGQKDLICGVNSTVLFKSPRGILILDGNDGHEMCHSYFGPFRQEIVLEDIDQDGTPEILVETGAVNNGNVAGRTDDAHSYMFAFNLDCEPVWPPVELGFTFTGFRFKVADLDNDGSKEIVIATYDWSTRTPRTNRIIILDAKTGGEVRAYDYGEPSLRGVLVCDTDNNGLKEIIVGADDGKVLVFSHNLKLLKSFTYREGVGVEVRDVCDLNTDGKPEFICTSKDQHLLILDNSLKIIYDEAVCGGYCKVLIVKTGSAENQCFVARFDDRTHFYHAAVVSKSLLEILTGSPLGPSLLVMLAFLAGVISLKKVRRQSLDKALLDAFLERSNSMVLVLDERKRIVGTNTQAQFQLHLDQSEITGLPYVKALAYPRFGQLVEFLDSNFEGRRSSTQRQIRVRSNGDWKDYLAVLIQIPYSKVRKERRRLLVLTDVSAIAESSLSGAWSTMAEGLMHDIKNILSPAKLQLENLQAEYSEGSPENKSRYDELVEPSITQIAQAAKFASRFMEFARKEELDLTLTDINGLLDEAVKERAYVFPHNISLKTDFDKSLPKIRVDQIKVRRVAFEMMENALKAIDPGKSGSLSIGTLKIQRKSEHSPDRSVCDFVQIEISDTGSGISEDNVAKIFDPYFTTQKRQRSGLGLAIVKKIIDQHKGMIEVESQEGIGTTFRIYLPVKTT